jgi:hypothetical protein
MNMHVLPRSRNVHVKFSDDPTGIFDWEGNLICHETQELIQGYVKDLGNWIHLMKLGRVAVTPSKTQPEAHSDALA